MRSGNSIGRGRQTSIFPPIKSCEKQLAKNDPTAILELINREREGAAMFQLENTKIYVGTKDDSRLRNDPAWAVINTAKTVHIEVKGWSNRPPQDHSDYLAFEDGQFLSFNWVDGASRMYDWSGPTAFIRALDFIDKWYGSKKILINCDQGLSRSPTVALLYLAKRMHVISGQSFAQARKDFQVLYPDYAPKGIADYVHDHWNEIQ